MPKIDETISSPNQSSRNSDKPQLIVCHIADGTYEGTKGWFQQSAAQTSSHFVVSQSGKICQCVGIDKMAWCNGTGTDKNASNYYGNATVPLIKKLGGNANRYSVSIEHEGYYSKTQGELTESQLCATVWLIQYIQSAVFQAYGVAIATDREHIVGHYEVNPVTRPLCPGPKFPWSELMQRLDGKINSGKTLYRVQVGAFKNEINARAYCDTMKDLYGQAFLVAPDEYSAYYRVQVGAFNIKSNADAYVDEIRKAGFNDAFIVVYEN